MDKKDGQTVKNSINGQTDGQKAGKKSTKGRTEEQTARKSLSTDGRMDKKDGQTVKNAINGQKDGKKLEKNIPKDGWRNRQTEKVYQQMVGWTKRTDRLPEKVYGLTDDRTTARESLSTDEGLKEGWTNGR